MKKILMTGGGSAGHVTPNIALFPALKEAGFEIHYAGLADGIERDLIEAQEGVTFHAIESGKLRRYLSLKNLLSPFKVIKGVGQAKRLVKELKPDVVFSKGGFVSVPVVMAASKKCPVVCHESDYTPGLANKIATRFADTICVTFEDTMTHASKRLAKKMVHTGTPIRPELYRGDRSRGLAAMGFDGSKPVLLVMGGSLGAAALNDGIRAALPKLTQRFDVVHLCGKGKVDGGISAPGYVQFEYVGKELPDMLAATSVVVSRAGANAVFEFLSLGIPALLVPLPLEASRGDQILNADYVARKGYAIKLEQKDITPERLCELTETLYINRAAMAELMKSDPLLDGTEEVLNEIFKAAGLK
ncbi:MAG: undecaprenyldiphospho-muramoylpentapeptide beta-N-acetylglucosaminyltransferase [Clostridiales bacterium]|nr:undecaprenyldiphospho-muramoylpentapeptide beta-N-acetylglucosaminyltransferase [Clostridiales bacterium]